MRGMVISKEDCNSLLTFLEGILIPSPPCRAGRAKRSRSRSLGGGLRAFGESREQVRS